MSSVRLFAVLVSVTVLGSVGSAHHSVVGYDRTKTVEVKGTVTEWRWRNPHCFLVLDVKDDQGKVVQWIGETNSTLTLQSAGVSRTAFKAGDPLTVVMFPNLKGLPQGVIQKIVTADGKVLLDQSGLEGPASAVYGTGR